MDDLSPAAQAVLDALDDQFYELNSQHMAAAVAALRAAADQVIPNTDDPEWFSRNCCERSVEIARNCVLAELLAIAAELEAQP